MKRIILFLLALSAAVTASAAALQRQQILFSEKLVRLHVVANSDTPQDQAIKLQVRDAVLSAAQGLDRQQLELALPRIQQAAQACLDDLGQSQSVCVSFCKERFPTRVYETFSLPAGVYDTLRVTIGAGSGHNWWCVVFPSICLRASAQEMEDAAVSAGFTQAELDLITSQPGYTIKFKCIEWLEAIKARFFAEKRP